MNAEMLDSSSSPTSKEKNYRQPVRPSVSRRRPWRASVAVSVGLLGLLASFIVVALSLRSRADHPSTAPTPAAAAIDDKRWSSLGEVDIEGGVTRLYPVQPGRVEKIVAKENEPIKAGAPLFYLEDKVPQLKVRRAKAGVKAAQGQLKTAQAEAEALDKKIAAQHVAIDAAEIGVKRARAVRDEKAKLQKDKLATDLEAKDAQYQLEKAEEAVRGDKAQLAILEVLKGKTAGAIDSARADLEDKQALLDEAQNAVKECVIRAPEDGIPLRINVSKGETLGNNPHQAAIQFAANRPRLVRAEVEQEFVGRVHPGQNVLIEDHVTGKECARGKVTSIALWYAPRRNANPEIVSMSSDNRTLECIIHIESTKQDIRIHQRVRVQFLD